MKDYIHHLAFGNGEVLILLPSNWLTSRSYQHIAQKLAAKYRVIVPDLYRGASRYGKNAFSAADYADSLHAFLKRFHIQKFYCIGISFSGMIALEYADKYPSHIKKMMLVSSIKFPVPIKKDEFTLAAGFTGYMKLFFHNSLSWKGIQINLLWLYEGIDLFINHTRQFFLDALIAVRYCRDSFPTVPTPAKILLASHDEFIRCKAAEKNDKLEIEMVAGNHTWFFLRENLLAEKVFDYFK